MFSAILHSIIWFWFKFIFYISYVSCFGIKGCLSVTSWAHTVTSRLTERGPLNTSTERREIVCDNKCWHFFKLLSLTNVGKELQDKKKKNVQEDNKFEIFYWHLSSRKNKISQEELQQKLCENSQGWISSHSVKLL